MVIHYIIFASAHLVCTGDDNKHLASVHHSSNTDSQSELGHLGDIAVKETSIGNDGFVGQGLDTSARGQGRTGLVEGNMTIGTNTAQEELDTTNTGNLSLELLTLFIQIRSITIQNVSVLGLDVDVHKEVLPHERVVGFRMITRQANVLVHVEGNNMLKADFSSLVHFDQELVYTYGRRASRKTNDKGTLSSRVELLDTLLDVVGYSK